MKKINYEKQFMTLAKKTSGLIKNVDEDLTGIHNRLDAYEDTQSKWVKLDKAKWTTLYRDYREMLKRNFKLTDMFCMQVADNKLLRAQNALLIKDLKNYVPEHPMFKEDDTSNNDNEEVEETEERLNQLEFDFEQPSFDDTKH